MSRPLLSNRKLTCPHCKGDGIEPPGNAIKACTACSGFGHTWVRRSRADLMRERKDLEESSA